MPDVRVDVTVGETDRIRATTEYLRPTRPSSATSAGRPQSVETIIEKRRIAIMASAGVRGI